MISRIVLGTSAVVVAAGALALSPTAASAGEPIMCQTMTKAKYDTNIRTRASMSGTSVGTFKKGSRLCASKVISGGYHAHCGGDRRWTVVYTISHQKAHKRYVATGCVSRIFKVW